MLFVLDTNILVASLSSKSEEHWVIERLLNEDFDLCVSHDILLEYEEILSQKYGAQVARDFLKALDDLPNVVKTEVHFHWYLLNDPDDNKFVDAAFSSGASYIVSEDRDFRKLKQIEFPKLLLLRLADFKKMF